MPSIIKNTSVLLIAHLVGRLLAFGLLILLPRYFNDSDVGAYLWVVATTNMMAAFIVFGMYAPLIREIAVDKNKAQDYISNALAISVVLSIVSMAAVAGTVNLLGFPQQTIFMVYIIGLSEVFNSTARLFRFIFRAFEDMKFEALTVIIERVFVFSVGGGVVVLGYNILTFCTIILVASTINLCLSLGIMLCRFTKLSLLKLRFRICKDLIVKSIPFALGGISNIIYLRIDMVMLPKLSVDGQTAVAWYGLAYSLVSAFTILPGSFTNAVFPVMSRAFSNQKPFQKLYTQSLKLMFILALPMALGITILTQDIVSLLWPRDTYPTWTIDAALRILIWAGGLIFLNNVTTTVLRATDKRTAFVTLIGTGMILNILLNLYLIPRMNHQGTAIAKVLTESYMFIVGFIYIHKKLTKLCRVKFVFRSALASTCMGILLFLLRGKIHLLLLIPIAGAIYLGIMILWRELKVSDILGDWMNRNEKGQALD